MLDKRVTVPRADIDKVVGAIDDESMLALFLEIARTVEKKHKTRRR